MQKMTINLPSKLLTVFLTITINSACFAFDDISKIVPPGGLSNIYVKALNSNKHASDFVIFIKKNVAAHYHEHHTELVYILEGEAIFELNNTRTIVKAGHFMRIEPKEIHSVQVISDIPLKVLSIQTPEFFGKDRIFVE